MNVTITLVIIIIIRSEKQLICDSYFSCTEFSEWSVQNFRNGLYKIFGILQDISDSLACVHTMQTQYTSPNHSESDESDPDEPTERLEHSIVNTLADWLVAHVPFKTLFILIIGVCFADDMKNTYMDMKNFASLKSSNITVYIGEMLTKLSTPEMSNAIALRMPQAVSGSLLIVYGIISVIIGSLALDKLKKLGICSDRPHSPKKKMKVVKKKI